MGFFSTVLDATTHLIEQARNKARAQTSTVRFHHTKELCHTNLLVVRGDARAKTRKESLNKQANLSFCPYSPLAGVYI